MRKRRPPTEEDYTGGNNERSLVYTRLTLKDFHPAGVSQRSGEVYGSATWTGDPMAAFESSFRALGDSLALETTSTHIAALESFKDLLRGHDIISSTWNTATREGFRVHHDDGDNDEDDEEYTGAGTGRSTRGSPNFDGNAESRITGSSFSRYHLRSTSGAAKEGLKRSPSSAPFLYGPNFTADTCVAYVMGLRHDTHCGWA